MDLQENPSAPPQAVGSEPPPPAPESGTPPRPRTRTRVRTALRWFFGLAALLGLVAGVAGTAATWRVLGSPPPAEWPEVARWVADPAGYVFRGRKSLNLLLLGLDYNRDSAGMPFSRGARSDTILVLNVDARGSGLRLLSLPRDTRVEIPGVQEPDKINAAFALGGVETTRETVKRLLGVPIDHAVVVRLSAARELVDALGGLRLRVEKDMDYDDNWGNLHIHLKQGEQLLNGEQVVGYSRFRHDEEADLGRIRRQQQVLGALTSRLKEVGPRALPRLVQVFRRNVDTDLSDRELLALARVYGAGRGRRPLRKATLPADPDYVDGLSFMIPREEEVRGLASRLLRSPEELGPAEIRVEVLNGSGVAGAASKVAEALRAQGFQVTRVGDHERAPHSRLVDRLGSLPLRQRVRALVPGAVVEEPTGSEADDPEITVILGGS